MILENLSVFREEYGPSKGKYRCTVAFSSQYTKQTLHLPESVSEAVLELIAENIITAGEDLAKNIRPAVEIAVNPQLEAPADAG